MTIDTDLRVYTSAPAELRQLEQLARLWQAEDFWPLNEVLISLKIPRTFLLYVVREDAWGGMALGREMGGTVELFYIFVDPAQRGHRHGSMLLEFFLAYARSQYCAERVSLEVKPSNERAIKLYEAFGFQKIGMRRRYYANGEDAWVFECKLDS